MMRMERRLRELQRIHDEKEKIEQEREERLCAIHKEYQEAKERRANRYRGILIYKLMRIIFIRLQKSCLHVFNLYFYLNMF